MSDPRLIVVAEIHGLAGRQGELLGLLAELADAARRQAGCVGYRVLTDGEPGELVLLASWRDEAALRSHYRTAAYQRYRAAVGPLLARPSDVVVHHVSTTLHARDPNPPDPGLLG